MSIRLITVPQETVPSKEPLESSELLPSKKPEIAAKKLVDVHELDMYFKPRPNINFCNHAVAVVAATAAIVAAASSVITAAGGRSNSVQVKVDLDDAVVSDLNVNELIKIRKSNI